MTKPESLSRIHDVDSSGHETPWYRTSECRRVRSHTIGARADEHDEVGYSPSLDHSSG